MDITQSDIQNAADDDSVQHLLQTQNGSVVVSHALDTLEQFVSATGDAGSLLFDSQHLILAMGVVLSKQSDVFISKLDVVKSALKKATAQSLPNFANLLRSIYNAGLRGQVIYGIKQLLSVHKADDREEKSNEFLEYISSILEEDASVYSIVRDTITSIFPLDAMPAGYDVMLVLSLYGLLANWAKDDAEREQFESRIMKLAELKEKEERDMVVKDSDFKKSTYKESKVIKNALQETFPKCPIGAAIDIPIAETGEDINMYTGCKPKHCYNRDTDLCVAKATPLSQAVRSDFEAKYAAVVNKRDLTSAQKKEAIKTLYLEYYDDLSSLDFDADRVGPNDPRIMTSDEYKTYLLKYGKKEKPVDIQLEGYNMATLGEKLALSSRARAIQQGQEDLNAAISKARDVKVMISEHEGDNTAKSIPREMHPYINYYRSRASRLPESAKEFENSRDDWRSNNFEYDDSVTY